MLSTTVMYTARLKYTTSPLWHHQIAFQPGARSANTPSTDRRRLQHCYSKHIQIIQSVVVDCEEGTAKKTATFPPHHDSTHNESFFGLSLSEIISLLEIASV
jgi:hypothetical protein